MLYSPSQAYQINTLVIGYSDSVLSASAVLIHGRASRLRASVGLRHNFILIYFRAFRDISIIRLGEPIDFNLISHMDMLSASFNMHDCDTKIHLLLAKLYRLKWEG